MLRWRFSSCAQRRSGPRKSIDLISHLIPLFLVLLYLDISLQDKVSILFADIVGFTRLSSGLEASRLVNMLNDLFGRFDKLCYSMKCEKVAILGDCYYCVAGCPEPDEDHAYNCVVMGLKICKTIKGNVFRTFLLFFGIRAKFRFMKSTRFRPHRLFKS